ncbi:UbiX family flavin prenyltransferase [Salmonella enterica]|nr:UbiX family flavin prenyltransferase [Salmonella enterica]EGT1166943.1 UbiX family flavin prenyltransferase [Salmonella enterica]
MRLIVGMTGATGAPLGVELLQALRAIPDVETHLVMSKWAKTTIELETPYTPAEVAALADYCHSPADQAATISSGSFRTDGMIIIPCSMKTLAGVRAGYAEGLVGLRAMTTPHGLGYVKMVIMVDEDVDPFNLPQVMWALSSKVNPAGDLVQLPNMSVLELDPGSSPAGITDKLIIDATTPVAPDNRGHYSQPVVDLPETKAWAEKLTAMLANRK